VLIWVSGVGCKSLPAESDPFEPNIQSSQESLAVKEDIVGAWTVIAGEDSFSSIIFEPDDRFYSYLYERPLGDGGWRIQKGVLEIVPGDDPSLTKRYTYATVSGNRLILTSGEEKIIWQRLPSRPTSGSASGIDGGQIAAPNTLTGPITEADLIGTWEAVAGYPPFERVTFVSAGTYSGEGPVTDEGIWLLTGQGLTLQSKFGLLGGTYTISQTDKGTIELSGADPVMKLRRVE